ncbi:MAG TPA: hypothetical protein VF867_20045 [Arthrobacter sp.]
MIVIGLSGNISAGKDTVADILVRDHGFTKMSFADPVKEMLRDLDPIVGYDIYQICSCEECEPEVEELRLSDLYLNGYDDETIKDSPWGDEVRGLWQRLGTEALRTRDPEFWVNEALEALGRQASERVVFTDVRFPNEAQMIYNLAGPFFAAGELSFSKINSSVWRITRTLDDEEADVHESEQYAGLMEEEITIVNDATLEELGEAVGIALGYAEQVEDPYEQYELWTDTTEEAPLER